MYARRPIRQKPRTSQLKAFPAPVAGWIANRNLAQPEGNGLPQGAAVLDNFFPTATSAVLRRGRERYATLGDGTLPTTALFSYVAGGIQRLFGATETTVYDITVVASPFNVVLENEDEEVIETDDEELLLGVASTAGLEVLENQSGGDWVTVQFATTGGIWLVGVNGENVGFIFDGETFYPWIAGGVFALEYDSEVTPFTEGETLTGGTSNATATILRVFDNVLWLADVDGDFENAETISDGEGGEASAVGTQNQVAPGIEFPEGVDLTTADLDFVWTYKNRLFFVQKDSLTTWYLPVDQVGGELTPFPLGGVFVRGGSLLFGATWSLDSGAAGGLSEQCVFVTTEGEVAVYQGSDPDSAQEWSKVGVYRIGRPMGRSAFIRAGGDIVIVTSIGFVPLSQAIQKDVAALSPSAVSFPIEDAWNEAVGRRGMEGWVCEIWPENQMVLVSPPATTQIDAVVFVVNARTGAWGRFTNWNALCMEVFLGRLYIGGPGGKVFLANVSGLDDGDPYTGIYMPLFETLGAPASMKIGHMARAVTRSAFDIDAGISLAADFDLTVAVPPDASEAGSGNEWGEAIWGEAIWGATPGSVISQSWQSIGGTGYALSAALQITSGAIVPLDVEIIRLEMTYSVAEMVT